MASMTFQVNDASTSAGAPAVWVTITENANGTLSFSLTQQGGIIGDLRGVFFDVADESVLGHLRTNAVTSDFRQGNDNITDLGDGANMNGLTGSDKGYDAGIEIGSAGIGKDDIQSYNFTLSTDNGRALTLADFANVDFGVRLTSVGTIGGSRADSSKIMESTSTAIDAKDDAATVDENHTASGNVLSNDTTGGGTSTVTSWDGGALGQAVELANSAGVTLTLNADGSWSLDASTADALSEGEHLTYTFHYAAHNQTEATSWSDDSATFTVTVNGVNDGPVAHDDAASVTEDSTSASAGSVIANDTDVDRLDTKSFVGWTDGSGQHGIDNAAGASITLNADGSWAMDAADADALSEGEVIAAAYAYTMTDNHGARSSAVLNATVRGVNDGPDANDDEGGRMFEDETLSGSVVSNDTDIDRLDTHTWSLVQGSFDGQGNLVFNADGTWSYDAAGAYDGLLDGDEVALKFQYTMTDNHGATDSAWVSFIIDGVGEGNPPPPPPPVDPAEEFLFNHGTNEFDHGWFPQLKDDTAEGFTSNDTLKIAGYGDIDDITVSVVDADNDGLADDTQFVVGMEQPGHSTTSTRTEDTGYLIDYTGLTADQINVTGDHDGYDYIVA